MLSSHNGNLCFSISALFEIQVFEATLSFVHRRAKERRNKGKRDGALRNNLHLKGIFAAN
jgi:hypothetical protein